MHRGTREIVSKNLDLFEAERQIVRDHIETINDVNTLQSMISPESSASGSDVVSDAASQRLLRLQAGSVASQALASSGTGVPRTNSTYDSFVTAQSRRESNLPPKQPCHKASEANHPQNIQPFTR